MLRLPLSAIVADPDAVKGSPLVQDFTAYHGYPPSEDNTWTEWSDAVSAEHRFELIEALIRTYPAAKTTLQWIAVDVAHRAALRVLPVLEAAIPEPRPRAALDLVKRWLDGEAVAVEDLVAAGDAANIAYSSPVSIRVRAVVAAAADTAYAASWCAVGYEAVNVSESAARHAVLALSDPADADAERTFQRADLDARIADLQKEYLMPILHPSDHGAVFRSAYSIGLLLTQQPDVYVYWTHETQPDKQGGVQGGTRSSLRPLNAAERAAIGAVCGVHVTCPDGVAPAALEFTPVKAHVMFRSYAGVAAQTVTVWQDTTADLLGLLHAIGVDCYFNTVGWRTADELRTRLVRKERDAKLRVLGQQVRGLRGRAKARRVMELVRAFEQAHGDMGLSAFVCGLVFAPRTK